MKSIAYAVLAVGLSTLATPVFATTPDANTAASRAAVKAFATTLKGELVAAIEAGGPVNAIQVCHDKAPGIATELSEKNAMRVARTSLKLRNPANAPDAWERKVLENFDARKAKGESPMGMEFSETVSENGKAVFRYMSAIPTTQMPCLACHGATIDPKVEAALKTLYPDDKARGYQDGDIRGAFSISIPQK